MNQPLYDVALQALGTEHLLGKWHVVTRALNRADTHDPLTLVTDLEMTAAGTLYITLPEPAKPEPGRWAVLHDPLLSRPYLEFSLVETSETRALITRLRQTREGDQRELTLYFQTGMELRLTQGRT